MKLDFWTAGIDGPLAGWTQAVDWSAVLIWAAVVLLTILFRRKLAHGVVKLCGILAGHLGLELRSPVETAVRPAVEALVVTLALLILVEALQLPGRLGDAAERTLISVMLVCVFAAIYALCKPLADLLEPFRSRPTRIQIDWIIWTAKALIVVLCVSAVLKIWGIDIGLMVTGMSIAGAAVALAAQDLFKNLIAGLTNMREKRFQIGDWIRVEGIIEGTVERVEFRSTVVKRFDLATVHVPNAELANAVLINFARLPHRRVYWRIGLVYQTTTQQLADVRKKIEDYIDGCGDFVPATDAARFVRVEAFNDWSIDIVLYCFTKTQDYEVALEVKEKLIFEIKTIVESCGTSFAFPSRSIYVEAGGEPDLKAGGS